MPVKRIALLGATGSIGRQAIDVIERNPELELCALAAGTSDLTELAREHGVEHTQTGGDVTELLEAAQPDVVLNAIVGFAGVGATLWALERGVTLTGGGALLRGLAERMHHELGVPVTVADDPLRAVARGAGRCVEEFDTLHRVLVDNRRP